jgi:hypothetical protein
LDLNPDIVRDYTPPMKKMQMKWTTIYGGNEEVVTRAAKTLQDEAGVMSILRIEAREERPLPPPTWAAFARHAVGEGVTPYFQLYNEPEIEFSTPERFAQLWGPRAGALVEEGAYVGLQTMSEEFFAAAAEGMTDAVKGRLFFVPHNYALNHPPNYPYNINKTIYEDDSALLRFLECARWCEKYLGFVPPMITVEGGALYSNHDDKTYPPVYGKDWVNWHREIYEWMRTGILSNGEPLPDYLFCVTSWLLGPEAGWYSDAWINGLHSDEAHANERDTSGVYKSALIEWLTSSEPFVRQFGARTTAPEQPEEPVVVTPEEPAGQPPATTPVMEQPAEQPPVTPPVMEQPSNEPTTEAREVPKTYTVLGGDTLGAIAKKLGVSVAALIAENGIENPNLIRPGQVLRIPRG